MSELEQKDILLEESESPEDHNIEEASDGAHEEISMSLQSQLYRWFFDFSLKPKIRFLRKAQRPESASPFFFPSEYKTYEDVRGKYFIEVGHTCTLHHENHISCQSVLVSSRFSSNKAF